jgi:hypothetical protein
MKRRVAAMCTGEHAHITGVCTSCAGESPCGICCEQSLLVCVCSGGGGDADWLSLHQPPFKLTCLLLVMRLLRIEQTYVQHERCGVLLVSSTVHKVADKQLQRNSGRQQQNTLGRACCLRRGKQHALPGVLHGCLHLWVAAAFQQLCVANLCGSACPQLLRWCQLRNMYDAGFMLHSRHARHALSTAAAASKLYIMSLIYAKPTLNSLTRTCCDSKHAKMT